MSKKNVIFIMCDSLQFNYVGCYGNDWIKTPNMDRLAREGTLFENAYIEGLPTIPCRRAMLTGRYTLQSKGWSPLDMDDTSIADILFGRGIHSGLIYDSAPMHLPKYGYSRGFDDVIFRHGHEADHFFYSRDELKHLKPEDYLEDHILHDENGNLRHWFLAMTLEEIAGFLRLRQYWRSEEDNYIGVLANETVKWLEGVDKTKPFMLWLDSFDPHEPWDPPSVWDPDLECPYDPGYKGKDMIMPPGGLVDELDYTDEELHHVRMIYAEKVTLVDKKLGKVFDKVRELGLWDDTMIILTSDHGEPMGKGEHGHGIMRKSRPWPYEELAHVPMIVRVPGVGEGKRVSSFVQSCDVAPTIIDYFGVVQESMDYGIGEMAPRSVTEEMQGHSLLPLVKGEKDKVRDFAIAGYYGLSWSIIRDDYSYVHWLANDEELASMETLAKWYDVIREDGKDFQTINEEKDEQRGTFTCTPFAETQVPARDELFDRQKDPFQLNNIIDQEPEKAKELLHQLRTFMAQLRTT